MKRPQPENISLADFLTWEQSQTERHEWIDGAIVPFAGVSFEHGTISSNLNALFHAAVGAGPCFVQPSDRQLVPRDVDNVDLGSFYADLFVSCAPGDRTGNAAHFPTVVVEVLSDHIGAEFTRKQRAYLGSAKLLDYLIIESTSRYVYRYSLKVSRDANSRRLVSVQYRRGPVAVPALDLVITFDQIYAGTNVSAILHPIASEDEEEADIVLD
jgi:Uma2 family endonuclease